MPTTTPFNNLITFSRGSNATVTGSNGLIQWAPNNLLTFSEQFDNAAWTKGGVSVTANNAVAPDGTTTADLLTGTGATPRVFQLATLINGASYTATCYVRQGTSTSIGFDVVNIQTGPVFTFATKTWSALSGVITAASFQELADGWFRLIVTFTSNTTSAGPGWYVSGNTTAWIWGAQLELGSTATTYNSTTVKNLLGFSEAFDNAAWTKTGASIVTGAQANPVNGLFNAQKLMEDTSNGAHRVLSAVTTAIQPYVLSAYFKSAGRSWVYLRLDRNGGTVPQAWFNITNGTIGTVQTGLTASIVNVGNGWYRCAITIDAAASGLNNNLIGVASADNVITYTGDGNSGVYIYGAQLSDSASLDPYVPTPGAAPSSTAFYGPRFDFDPVTLLPRGLLVEEQRTNLALQSETFTLSRSSFGYTYNKSFPAPDGQNTATKIIPDNGSTLSGNVVYQNVAKTASSLTYTYSIFAKAGEFDRLRLLVRDTASGSNYARVTFDLINKTVAVAANVSGTFTSPSVAIQNGPNGFTRYSLTFTTGTEVSIQPSLIVFDTTATTGNGTSGIFIYGEQLEAGAFATSYIPTVASTVTRSADVATISGSLFSQWFNQSEGTWAFDFGPFNLSGIIAGTGPYDAAIGAVTNGVRSGKQFSVHNSTGWGVLNKTGTPSVSAAIAGSAAFAPLTGPAAAQKLAIFQSTNASGGSINGGTVTTTTLTATPTGTADLFYINPLMNGWFRNIRFIPARAADFQLQGLST